jgi:hypothetical protein
MLTAKLFFQVIFLDIIFLFLEDHLDLGIGCLRMEDETTWHTAIRGDFALVEVVFVIALTVDGLGNQV